MKLGDIDIPDTGIMVALYALWGYFGLMAIMTILMIVKAIALHCFDYVITIGGIPL
jgi:hypothetical protein